LGIAHLNTDKDAQDSDVHAVRICVIVVILHVDNAVQALVLDIT
jgi:hypothetical protein